MTLKNLLATAARTAVNAAIKATKTPATIRRSGGLSAIVEEMGRGQQRNELQLVGDAFSDEEHREQFLIWPRDYDFGAGPVEPAEGDTIEIDDETTLATYEVNAQQPDPAFRYVDRFRTAWRVYVVLISEEPSP